MHDVLLDEFRFDWELSGKSTRTVLAYIAALRSLFEEIPSPELTDAKSWIAASEFVSVRRKRGQALRAFGRWSDEAGDGVFPWWKQVPLAVEKTQPQPTATEEDYRKALKAATTLRDRTVVEILWWCGLRRGELAVLDVEDLNLADGYLVIRQSKTGSPRVVPLSPSARRSIRRLVGARMTGLILGMSSNAIRLLLQRLDAPSAHAWRRGWAVEALRRGVSEVSVRSAAGWSSGAMVARYTRALSAELAVSEFQEAWRT